MRKKRKAARLISGCMALVSLLSAVVSPMMVSAAESPTERVPYYEEVKDQLDMDEVVTAHDYEVTVGASFDINCDFSGIEIPDNKKVKVTFQEALNEDGDSFATDHEDTYQAVYYVEPQTTSHPMYQISRNITVKEAAASEEVKDSGTEASPGQDKKESEPESSDEEGESETPAEMHSEEEFDKALERSEDQKTVDEDSGLTLGEVLLQAADQGVDIQSLEVGESVTFTAQAPRARAARATQSVTITQGSYYYYADYGLGSYVTAPFTVKFGNVSATAYCIQPSKPGPGSGTYQITKLEGKQELAKTIYYGTEASGAAYFFNSHHKDFSAGKRFIVTHLAASYANDSSDAFYGTNSTGEALAMELYHYAVSQPEIPNVEMSFSNSNVTAYVDGGQQRTEDITFKASSQQTITMDLPDGVKLHNISTGKTSAAGAKITISGGTKFYLTAPLTQTKDVSGSWSAKCREALPRITPLIRSRPEVLIRILPWYSEKA